MQQVAVVDANVIRVLARLRRLAGDQKGKPMIKLNAQLADSLVDPDRPGCFNQVGLTAQYGFDGKMLSKSFELVGPCSFL